MPLSLSTSSVPARCESELPKWSGGCAPVAVVMISLNEAHNMEAVLENLSGWAQEVFLVDSYSADDTVDIALRYGVHVVQRRFRGFGDQWNFALRELPIAAPWTMKLDPDERLTESLKHEIQRFVSRQDITAFVVPIRLHFMGARLPSVLRTIRIWRTASANFSNVLANEHVLAGGKTASLSEEIKHFDSPSLEHWFNKQNRYSTSEAVIRFEGHDLADRPSLFGSGLQRRMWLKKHFWKVPWRYTILFAHHLLIVGAWRAGRVGWIWSRLRVDVYRMQEYKVFEMQRLGRVPITIPNQSGLPDKRVPRYD